MMTRELTYGSYERHKRMSKPAGPTKRYRAKRRRAEAPALTACRKHADRRDGPCKLSLLGECAGPSELMHLRPRTRAQTRGMAPAYRHSKEFTMNGCRTHHRAYDAGELTLSMFPELGAQGPIVARWRGRRVEINA